MLYIKGFLELLDSSYTLLRNARYAGAADAEQAAYDIYERSFRYLKKTGCPTEPVTDAIETDGAVYPAPGRLKAERQPDETQKEIGVQDTEKNPADTQVPEGTENEIMDFADAPREEIGFMETSDTNEADGQEGTAPDDPEIEIWDGQAQEEADAAEEPQQQNEAHVTEELQQNEDPVEEEPRQDDAAGPDEAGIRPEGQIPEAPGTRREAEEKPEEKPAQEKAPADAGQDDAQQRNSLFKQANAADYRVREEAKETPTGGPAEPQDTKTQEAGTQDSAEDPSAEESLGGLLAATAAAQEKPAPDASPQRTPAQPDRNPERKKHGMRPMTGNRESSQRQEGAEADTAGKPAGLENHEKNGTGQKEKEKVQNTAAPEQSPQFPDELHKNGFVFYYDAVTVTDPNGTKEKAELIIAPLSLEHESTDVIMWVLTDDGEQVEQNGIRRTMAAHLGLCDIIVSGIMLDGKFVPRISLSKKMSEAGYVLEEKSHAENGSGGHILLEDKGIAIHIFPIGFENSRNGFADFFYLVTENGESRTGVSDERHELWITFEGFEKKVVAKWTDDNVMHAAVFDRGCI